MKKAKIEVTGDDKQWEVNVTMPCGPRSVRASPRGAAFVIAGIVEREQSFVYADQSRRYFDCLGRYLGRGKGLEPAEYGVPCSFDEVSVEEISVSLDGAAKKASYIEIEQADNVEKASRQKIYRVVESPLDFIRSDDLIFFPERRELPSLDGKTSRLDYCGATLAIMSRRQARNAKIACVSD